MPLKKSAENHNELIIWNHNELITYRRPDRRVIVGGGTGFFGRTICGNRLRAGFGCQQQTHYQQRRLARERGRHSYAANKSGVGICVYGRVSSGHLVLNPKVCDDVTNANCPIKIAISGGPAVLEQLLLVRPVTLRRHLSVVLPLSESRRALRPTFRWCFRFDRSDVLFVPGSCGAR